MENVDHYRNKVRPALRAFVNQIEGSGMTGFANANSNVNEFSSTPKPPTPKSLPSSPAGGGGGSNTPSSSSKSKGGIGGNTKKSANEKALAKAGLSVGKTINAGNFGSRYVIVFVPLFGNSGSTTNTADNGGGNNNTGGNTSGGGGGGGFGGFRAGRKGQQSSGGGGIVLSDSKDVIPLDGSNNDSQSTVTATTTASSSTHHDGNTNTNNNNNNAASTTSSSSQLPPSAIGTTTATTTMTKEVKELYQKFNKDFPNGRTVIMGSILLDVDDERLSNNINTNTNSNNSNHQEWKAFLHNLGGAIIDGFHDRVQRYDEELRRLDSKRVAFVRRLSSSDNNNTTSSLEEEQVEAQDETDEGTSKEGGGGGGGGGKFDLSHFFLVKESLAFTYEQMQLFEEAKLQYEELNAFLPEDGWRRLVSLMNDTNTPGRRKEEDGHDDDDGDDDGDTITKTTTQRTETETSPLHLAMSGDSTNFRHHIKKSGKDLHGVSQYVPQYMFSREVRLLFQMKGSRSAALDVLTLSKNFILRSYRGKLLDVDATYNKRWRVEIEGAAVVDSLGEEIMTRQTKLKMERLRKEAEVEAWALASCWDVKVASGYYFTFATTTEEEDMASAALIGGRNNSSPMKGGGGTTRQQNKREGGSKTSGSSTTASTTTIEEAQAARCLAELLEFAILRLMRLADLALGSHDGVSERTVNPIRRATSERPLDTLKPWEPWRKLQKVRDEIKAKKRLRKSSNKDDASDDESWPSILPTIERGVSTWIHKAMENASIYEETYLELAEATVILNRHAGRFRFASRLEDHRAEVLIARGEYDQAANVLSSNVGGSCARDQWTRAHYWRIFRLACCQRMVGDVLAYLETLTQSFNPKLSSVAPKKTASLFQQDLEAIITDAGEC